MKENAGNVIKFIETVISPTNLVEGSKIEYLDIYTHRNQTKLHTHFEGNFYLIIFANLSSPSVV